MSEEKQYYAFISYKREDKRDAKRLQHQLEYYRLPNQLRRDNPDLPEYVRPIFRDMTDLEVGELSTLIHEALEHSHYLIVVCSPRAAKSKWVNDEVEYFISLGKQDKIIPYIIEGVPHADDPSEECYPPALLKLSKEKELLGANINEVGKEAAGIRVVAKMFGIRFDTLYQRYQREQKRKRRVIVIAIALVIFLLLSFVGYVLDNNHLLQKKNDLIKFQNETLEIQKCEIEQSRDSIIKTNALLQKSQDSIESTNQKLIEYNEKLVKSNWQLLENDAKAVASIAEKYLQEGDAYDAMRYALSVLPHDMKHPTRPWTEEAEFVLRRAAVFNNSCVYTPDASFSAVFNRDNSLIVSTHADSMLRLFEYSYDKPIRLKYQMPLRASYAQYSPNEQYIIANDFSDTSLVIIDAKTLHICKRLTYPSGLWGCFAFDSTNNVLISSSYSGDFLFWNLQEGKYFGTLRKIIKGAHKEELSIFRNSFSVSTDGTRLISTLAFEDKISIWDIPSGNLIREIYSTNMSNDIFLIPNSHNILYLENGFSYTRRCIKILYENDSIATLPILMEGVSCCSVSHNGKLAAVVGGNEIHLVDLDNLSIIRTYNYQKRGSYSGIMYSVAFNASDNQIITGGADGTIRTWDVEQKIFNPTISVDASNCVASFDASGTKIITAHDDRIIRIWDSKSEQLLQSIDTKKICHMYNDIDDVEFIDNNNIICRYSNYKVKINLSNYECIVTKWCSFMGDTSLMAYSRDSLLEAIVLHDNYNIQLTNRNGKAISLKGHMDRINSVVFSNDGKLLVSAAEDGTIRVWNTRTGKIMHVLYHDMRGLYYAAISYDKKRVATVDMAHRLYIWDLESEKVTNHIVFVSTPRKVCFSPDDERILCGLDNGEIKVLYFPPIQKLINASLKRI